MTENGSEVVQIQPNDGKFWETPIHDLSKITVNHSIEILVLKTALLKSVKLLGKTIKQ